MKTTPYFHFVSDIKKTPEKRNRVAQLLKAYRRHPEKFRWVFREPGRYMVESRGYGVIAVFETRPA